MRGFVGLCALLTGCGFQITGVGSDAAIDDARGLDSMSNDSRPDPACVSSWMYTASNFDPCEPGHVVHSPLALGGGNYTFAPATGVLALDGATVATLPTSGTSPAVLSLAGLQLVATTSLRIEGTTPLIIAVHGGAIIDGTITVSAEAATSGPGGGSCVAGAGSNALAAPASWTAGGGGGGGGFGSPGGTGGTGDVQPGYPKTPGGTASSANTDPMLVPLRGGCSGGAGGQEDPSCTSPGTPGVGGGGGGALQVSVRNGLILGAAARLAANGGGGVRAINGTYVLDSGGHVGAGGGGGGSGGAIFVEGLTISIASSAMLCANGGSGGGGSHNNDGPITDGVDGACALSAAPGGAGINGWGGNGAFGSTAAENGDNGNRQDDGGGGAGGGVGRIRVRAATGARPQGFGSTPAAVID